ncbi:MAG: hypothetical protein JKY65_17010 [Planctomycetes bacterium]|nr:hypothetical protein [Planctomycetota bacterium]
MSASLTYLTYLCAIPLGAGLLALAVRRGARVVACTGALLVFLLVVALGQRFEVGAAATLRAQATSIAKRKVAQRLGKGEVLRERVAPQLLSGLSYPKQQELAESLSGRRIAVEQLRAGREADDAAAIHSGVLAVQEAQREERRLRAGLSLLDQELGSLRRASQTSIGDAAYPELRSWLPGVGSQWFVALDGIGLVASLAIALLALCCSFMTQKARDGGPILLGAALLLVAALAQDALLFAAAWTGFVLLGSGLLLRWPEGDEEGARSGAIRLLVPGLLGALALGGACLWLAARTGSLDFAALRATAAALSPREQALFLAPLLLACATRLPLPPFHGWLPAAAGSGADPAGLAFLQGGSLLLGALGLARLVVPFGPDALADPRVIGGLFAWGVVSIGFLALAALGERDLRRQAALSAACVGGIALCGVVTGDLGQSGGLLEGTVGALAGAVVLLAAGVTARRGGADALALGGVGSLAPRLAAATALGALALAGIPLSAAFAARARIWEGAWQALPKWAVLASLAPFALLALGLWWSFQRVFLGERRGAGRFRDLDLREAAALFTLLLAVFVVGLDPLRWLALLAR